MMCPIRCEAGRTTPDRGHRLEPSTDGVKRGHSPHTGSITEQKSSRLVSIETPPWVVGVRRPGHAWTPSTGRSEAGAISADDVWAAGLSSPGGSLIVHWNGSAWGQSLIGPGYLEGVAGSSAANVWAVG